MMRHDSRIISSIAVLAFLVTSAPLAADEVAVVSAKSTITTLSKTQMADIFLGKTTRFPDGAPVVPIDQSEGTVARDAFYMWITGKSAGQMKAYWSRIIFTGRGQPPRIAANSRETRKLVAANPDTIGYVEPQFVDDTLRVVTVTE